MRKIHTSKHIHSTILNFCPIFFSVFLYLRLDGLGYKEYGYVDFFANTIKGNRWLLNFYVTDNIQSGPALCRLPVSPNKPHSPMKTQRSVCLRATNIHYGKKGQSLGSSFKGRIWTYGPSSHICSSCYGQNPLSSHRRNAHYSGNRKLWVNTSIGNGKKLTCFSFSNYAKGWPQPHAFR